MIRNVIFILSLVLFCVALARAEFVIVDEDGIVAHQQGSRVVMTWPMEDDAYVSSFRIKQNNIGVILQDVGEEQLYSLFPSKEFSFASSPHPYQIDIYTRICQHCGWNPIGSIELAVLPEEDEHLCRSRYAVDDGWYQGLAFTNPHNYVVSGELIVGGPDEIKTISITLDPYEYRGYSAESMAVPSATFIEWRGDVLMESILFRMVDGTPVYAGNLERCE